MIETVLPVRRPLHWDYLLHFLGGRGAAGVEAVLPSPTGPHYARTVRLQCADGRWHQGYLRLSETGTGPLCLQLSASLAPVASEVGTRLSALVGADADIASIDAALARHAAMAPLVAAAPGLRVPGAFDGFELLLRAVLGQQVTVKAATTLFGRAAVAFGAPISTPHPELCYLAPTAEAIAAARLEDIIRIGMPARRAACMLALSTAVADGRLSLSRGQNPSALMQQLQGFAGIGPWTAHYVAMRALGWEDAWPEGDLGLYHATGTHTPKTLAAAGKAYAPYRAYAALRFWQQGAHSNGG